MAVMTSHLPEGVAIEQKTQPVPSSDKMALDLDINGSANRDETNINDAATETPLIDPVPSPLPSEDVAALDFPEVNGSSNVDAFSSNKTIAEPASLAVESQATEPSSTSAQEIPSSNTTTEEHLPVSTDLPQPEILEQSSSAESAIDAAVEDSSASTTVPMVIDAPESDLRHTSLPPAPEQPEQSADLGLDLDSAQLPTPKPEKETDSSGGSAEVADLTFEQNEAVPENPLDLVSNSPLPPAPTAEESFPMEAEQTTPPQATQETNGTEGTETSQPTSLKIARERENDDEIEPAAKRTKTETEHPTSDMAPPTQNGHMEGVEPDPGSAPLTQYQIKELSKILKAVSRSAHGKNFRAPVAELWPTFVDAYAAKIEREVDLKTMEKTLIQGGYATMNAFREDVHMVYNNAFTFNGPGHMITNSAVETRNSILAKIENIPAEPVAAPKRDKKAKRNTPVPDAGARDRRVNKGSNPAPTNVDPAAQTFAVDPVTNTPVIRRDSTKGDGGRPKREIHPPKSKDLVYASSRPKNKKFATELKFCEDVLTEIMKAKYWQWNGIFMHPVDPVALGIPNYFAIIKKPMDLSTIKTKLIGGQYNTAGDFEKDMRQMIWNCLKYNPPGNPVHATGKAFENLFNEEWDKKDAYIAEHSPAAATPELPESDEDEDEEEEEEAHNKSSLSQAKEILLEHQQKLINLMSAKNKDEFAISMQQDLVALVTKRVEDESQKKKSTKKVKSSKAPKRPVPPPKKSGAVKKSGPSRPKYMGTLEKETISAGLTNLPDDVSMQVLEDIKRERPGLDAEDDGTLELDIDSISQSLLWKIHGLIMKHAPEVEASIKKAIQARESPKAPAKPPPKKKNKPMSSVDQERNISILQEKMGTLQQRQASGSRSQEPAVVPTTEMDESSGDDSSDSEEE
ncbi:hypothetical protein VTL71DRAFT_12497 [Oculimacula yallundae]|uniref:Bromodomain-containing protein n=1 Tax=Oculimacula yallundae TaxID=86028 RepID=A0ABR4CN98_9HELO